MLCTALVTGLVAFDANINAQAAGGVTIGSTIYVDTPPPVVVHEIEPDPRPGYVWAPGYYEYRGNGYKWKKGKWLKAREGVKYVPAQWYEDEDDRGYYFVPGEWKHEETIVYAPVRTGYKAGYWKSEYTDYNYVTKHGRGKRVKDRVVK